MALDGGVIAGVQEAEVYRDVPADKSVDHVLSPEQLREAGEAFRLADMSSFPRHASFTPALTRDDRWALKSANETTHLTGLVTH